MLPSWKLMSDVCYSKSSPHVRKKIHIYPLSHNHIAKNNLNDIKPRRGEQLPQWSSWTWFVWLELEVGGVFLCRLVFQVFLGRKRKKLRPALHRQMPSCLAAGLAGSFLAFPPSVVFDWCCQLACLWLLLPFWLRIPSFCNSWKYISTPPSALTCSIPDFQFCELCKWELPPGFPGFRHVGFYELYFALLSLL